MGDLLIRNVPEDLKRNLTEAARRAGHSLSEEAKKRLRYPAPADASVAKTGLDLLQSIQASLRDVPDDDREEFARIMDEVEEQRRKDFGRPFSFEE